MSRRIIGLCIVFTLAGLTAGCGGTLPLLVGENYGPQGKPKNKFPRPFVMGFTPSAPDPQTAKLTGEPIGPPTIPFADTEDSDAEPDTQGTQSTAGPRLPIAVAPLSDNLSQLSGLGAAALRSGSVKEGRFVLLVLSPPAANAAEMNRSNAHSRDVAKVAVQAIADAGIPADNVEVAAATNSSVGAGELRLYRR